MNEVPRTIFYEEVVEAIVVTSNYDANLRQNSSLTY